MVRPEPTTDAAEAPTEEHAVLRGAKDPALTTSGDTPEAPPITVSGGTGPPMSEAEAADYEAQGDANLAHLFGQEPEPEGPSVTFRPDEKNTESADRFYAYTGEVFGGRHKDRARYLKGFIRRLGVLLSQL